MYTTVNGETVCSDDHYDGTDCVFDVNDCDDISILFTFAEGGCCNVPLIISCLQTIKSSECGAIPGSIIKKQKNIIMKKNILSRIKKVHYKS